MFPLKMFPLKMFPLKMFPSKMFPLKMFPLKIFPSKMSPRILKSGAGQCAGSRLTDFFCFFILFSEYAKTHVCYANFSKWRIWAEARVFISPQSSEYCVVVIGDNRFVFYSDEYFDHKVSSESIKIAKIIQSFEFKDCLCFLFGGLYGQQNAFLQSNYKDSNFFIIFSKYSNAHLVCFWKKLPKECPGFVRHEHFVLASFRYL